LQTEGRVYKIGEPKRRRRAAMLLRVQATRGQRGQASHRLGRPILQTEGRVYKIGEPKRRRRAAMLLRVQATRGQRRAAILARKMSQVSITIEPWIPHLVREQVAGGRQRPSL
jgi:hypothetical protein